MSAQIEQYKARLREALGLINDLNARLDAVERQANEPIAIVGMGCRFPGGGNSPEAFWQSLERGVDAIREIPADRWPPNAIPGDRQAARWAALLDDVTTFDASFFGISPREAESLDPQQRMLLEVTWEALENAGYNPGQLVGSRTGVFIGICTADYQYRVGDAQTNQFDAYCGTGNAYSTAAGRISFVMGFQGPAVAIDTACSSSLVAISMACQSLRAGDASLVVAGGVNAILSPRTMALLLETQALSPDGRCKTMDARANGFVRGEGCGIVVLKRYSDAVRDGDRIFALIRGWAVNQDGRSTGLTTPNVLSQQAMLRQALERAKLSPEDIDYIEMHGTGTSLGDPIEVEALREVLGAPRKDGSKCILGAVKTNIGHLEGAAGVAGLIKVLLALDHEKIPKNLHFRRLNPRISLDDTPFVIPTESVPWMRSDKPRCAGVSSFGISGTNAHIIVEEAPRPPEATLEKEHSAYLLALSAKTPQALTALARSYGDWFGNIDDSLVPEAVHVASMRRMHHEHRLGVVGRNKKEFAELLQSFAAGGSPSGVVKERITSSNTPRIVFVFSGQGSQWAGMGKTLLDEEPVFRAAVEKIDALMSRHASFSLLSELRAPEATSKLDQTEIVQPALFALQVGLAQLLKSWGIKPHAVMGHSVGELAAAHVSGALPLETAVRLVVLRGRIMQRATGNGKMVWVGLDVEAAGQAIAGLEDVLAIAAINDPKSVVLSGEAAALDTIVADLGKRGVVSRQLRVNYAFHSPQMESHAREFVTAIGRLETASNPDITLYSSLTGKQIGANALIAEYWGLNILNSVNFASAVKNALQDGLRIFVEIGPHPVLLQNVHECAAFYNSQVKTIPTLRRQLSERYALLETAGGLHVEGLPIDWKNIQTARGIMLSLPTYAWQRERYWLELPTFVQHSETREPNQSEQLDQNFYAIEWKELVAPAQDPQLQRQNGSWLLFVDDGGTGETLAARLRSQGHSCMTVHAGKRFVRTGSFSFTLDVEDRESLSFLLREAFPDGNRCAGIVYLFTANQTATPGENTVIHAQSVGFIAISYLLQAILVHMHEKPPLWLVTRGAVAVQNEPMALPVHAPVWGLGRTIDLEHPELRCARIDLGPRTADSDSELLLREMGVRDGELQIALRQGKRYAARLVQTRVESATPEPDTFQANATYLITGGLGGLGLSLASWMARHGARQIVLTGRKAPSVEVRQSILDIEKQTTARIRVLLGNVGRYADMMQIFATIADEMPPLRGVVHAAGFVGEPVPIVNIGRESFDTTAQSKIRGTWNLHTLTKDLPLDFFILYSSASATLGLVGQASYAGANAFMDAMAAWRGQKGAAWTSIQWGAFDASGMGQDSQVRERLAGGGMVALTPKDASMAIARLLKKPRPNIAVMAFSGAQLAQMFPHIGRLPYFREVLPAEIQKVTAASAESGILHELRAASPITRKHEILEQHVLKRIGEILRLDPSRIDRLAPFSTLGVDSLMSIELRNRLQPDLNLTLPATLLFAQPTPAALIAYLFDQLKLTKTPHVPPPPPPEPRTVVVNQDIPLRAPLTPVRAAGPSVMEKPAPAAAPERQTLAEPAAASEDIEARLAAKLAAIDKLLDDD